MAIKDKYGASKLSILDDESESADPVDESYFEGSRSPALNSFSNEPAGKKPIPMNLRSRLHILKVSTSQSTKN